MKQLSVLLFSCLFFCAFSCNDSEGDSNESTDCDSAQSWTIQDADGLDGCTWLLQSSEFDFRLEPINLLEFIDAPSDGADVNILYEFRDDMASTCMAGRIVEISCLD